MKWIDVENKLPEEPGLYRVILRSGGFNTHSIETRCRWRKRSDGEFEWGCEIDWTKVSHWRSL